MMTTKPRPDVGDRTLRVIGYAFLVVLLGFLGASLVLLKSVAADAELRAAALIIVASAVLMLVSLVLHLFAREEVRKRLRVPEMILTVLVFVATVIVSIRAR